MHEAFLAVAMIGCAAFAWDACRRWMELEHGRALSADRSQTFERAITSLDLSNKQLDHGLDQLKQRMDGIEATAVNRIDGAATRLESLREELVSRIEGLAEDAGTTMVNEAKRFTNIAEWQKQCEQSIVLLQGEVDKRDKAIVSCVEEIRAIREQQAMALAGVANLPARGFAGKQRTP